MALPGSSRSLADELARGSTLPAPWYVDPAVLALERIFARTWQYLGRAEQVAAPGDYLAGRAGHIPVVAARGEDGVLRGFVNVCRHRGHEVAIGSGNRRALQCPYHAWTYGLDGTLRTAPRSDREPGFPRDDLFLLPIAVDTWGPFVFVNPERGAPPLAEVLGELPSALDSSGLRLSELRFRERREWVIAANWKVAIENYLECYHCPVAHPGFSALLDVGEDAYEIAAHRWHSSQFGHVRPAALQGGDGVPYDPRGEVTVAQYHLLWPNFTINVEAGPANLSVNTWVPDGPERTVGISDWWFGPEVPRGLQDEVMAFSEQVGQEDNSLVESVQRGLASAMVPQGRLLLGSEKLIHHFQALVLEALS